MFVRFCIICQISVVTTGSQSKLEHGVASCYLRIAANPGEALGFANLIDQMPCHAPAYWLATESGFACRNKFCKKFVQSGFYLNQSLD